MKINIICMGNIKEKFFRQAIDEYIKRISKFSKVEIVELKEEKISQNPSDKEIESALSREAEKILAKIAPNSFSYILAVEGKQMDSVEFAKDLSNKQVQGYSSFNFIIGSSHGLSDMVKSKGVKFSFSKMTFPHQLMRVILLEQVYRAFKINNNEEYHK